jgi:hypothetical protein
MSPERENNQKEFQKWRSESTPAAALKQLLLLVNFPKWKEWRTSPSFSLLAFFNTSGESALLEYIADSWVLFHIKVRITVLLGLNSLISFKIIASHELSFEADYFI